jgi:hypothetical protein
MPAAGFETAIPARDRPQLLALDRPATGLDPRPPPPERAARSESLYRLIHPGPHATTVVKTKMAARQIM